MANTTPILVASGQYVFRGEVTAETAMSPVDIAAKAASVAIAAANAEKDVVSQIDTIAFIRGFIDSIPGGAGPFGASNNVPRSLAKRIGANPRHAIYGREGGQSPQRFVNEFAEKIAAGEMSLGMIAGAEATGIMKQVGRAGLTVDWSETVDGDLDDRGCHWLFTEHEVAHGITFPTQVYPLFENAWRARHGLSVKEHRQLASELFSAFSNVAANNPYSQFPVARSAEFLNTVSDENYWVAHPHTKWMVAQDAVNQGAALLMCSVDKAVELGIPESQWIYLHSYADVDDRFVSARPDLAVSESMKLTLNGVLNAAGKTIADIDVMDIYSCFPIAVLAACEAMGLDWHTKAPLTVTGGLPFFGGAGNSYSTHAIASLTDSLRQSPSAFGLITANGGFLSKQSVGLYSAQAPHIPCHNADPALQAQFDSLPIAELAEQANGRGIVETFTLTYKRGKPDLGIVIGRLEDGRRFLSNTAPDDEAAIAILQGDSEVIGRQIEVSHRDGKNTVRFV
ncbi:acetyl-CoA acetyltransferase [Zhongshania sp. BJYM1]|uniref:acetyl-CoA acetyltransferase n=1 Tax=Zhongshania aquatica TaxID=2965069 RepID=UPI0022B3BE28|nr:acetyl-CoA acetyltransferase [Marortus sp. BJYM1]